MRKTNVVKHINYFLKTFIVCRKTFLKQSFVYRKTRFEKILFLKHFLLKTFENIYVVFLKFRVSPFFWKQIFYFKNCFWKQIFFGFEKQLLKTDFSFFFENRFSILKTHFIFWKQIYFILKTDFILKTVFFSWEKKKKFPVPLFKKKKFIVKPFFFF